MRKYITLFFSVSVVLFSCRGNKTNSEIINPDRMVSLLTDVHLVDGTMYNISQNPDTLYKYGTGRYLTLFRKHHTTSLQFRKSLEYYATDPSELLTIYDKVLDNLKQKTDSLNRAEQNKKIK